MIRIPIMVGGEYKAIFETHEAMHFEEIVAFILIEGFGDKKFLQQYAKRNIISVGVGGGPFDEHPKAGSKRKEGECGATLVAKALEVDDDPGLKEILKLVLISDLKGSSQPGDISSLANLISRQSPKDPEKVIKWVEKAIRAKYKEQFHFHTVTREEFSHAAKVEFVKSEAGVVKMVVIRSDDEQASKFARSAEGSGAAIIIQKKTSGNIQIYTAQKFGINLDDVARMINLAEQQAGGRVLSTDWEILSAEGTIPGGRWHYFPQGGMILNGSLTYPDVPATKITLEQIERIVRIGVDPSLFPRHCLDSRRCLLKECDWHSWGLIRCQIRRR